MRRIVIAGLAAALIASCGPQKREQEPAAPAPVALPASTGLSLDGRITGSGAAPDWRLDVAPEGVRFTHPSGAVTAPYVAPAMDEAGALLASGKIKARFLVQPCTIAGSDVATPMRVRVEVQGVGAFDGCAYARWDNGLESLIPAIDACLGATTEPSPVIFAAPLEQGTLVRLRGVEDGERYDCVVDPSGLANILQSEAPVAPGERDPTFTRAPTDTPPRACEAVEIKGKDGVLLGWETHGQTC